MTRWGKIKCPKCAAPPIALWDALVRQLEESDARESRLEARIEELEAENAQLKQMWWDAGDVTDLVGTITDLQAERDALREAVDEVTEYAKRHEAERNALVMEANLAIAAYRIEAMRREDYSHDAFDQHIAALKGRDDE